MWKFSGLFRCEKFQAFLGVKISGLKFSGVKFFNPPYLAQFQPNLHVKILAWSHVKISGLKQVWFTCENRCDRFGTGHSHPSVASRYDLLTSFQTLITTLLTIVLSMTFHFIIPFFVQCELNSKYNLLRGKGRHLTQRNSKTHSRQTMHR